MGFFQTSGILNRRGFFGGVAAAFKPSDIAGLQLWLDATTGLFDATSGGSAVTTDGSAVARWEDQSGNGRHAKQTTLNNRPILKTAAKNSKNILRFDGTNDCFKIDSFTLVSKRTSFIAFSSTSNSLQIIYEHSTNYNNFNGASIFYVEDSAGFSHGWRDNAYSVKKFTTRNSGAVLLAGFHNNTHASLTMKQNNVALTGANINTPSDINTSGSFDFFISARNQGSLFLNGDIYEMAIYDTSLSSSDESKVVDYLNTKWSIY